MSERRFKRIAIEESYTTPEIFAEMREVAFTQAAEEPGEAALWGDLMRMPEMARFEKIITDAGEGRIRAMDAAGVDVHLLSLTAPGVQIFPEDKAIAFARLANDRLAEAVRANPDRFAGLAAVAPQNPAEAARELERGMNKLGLKGLIINSHTRGEYLDDQKFWPIFEAAQALNAPIYIHPRTPSPGMVKPYIDYPIEGPVWGFSAETALHALRLMLSGVFDVFPRLTIVLGHLGEGLPFLMTRVDIQYKRFVMERTKSPRARKLKRTPLEYFTDNFVVSTSGMNFQEELLFCHKMLGADRIMFAVDYPFERSDEAVQQMDALPIPESDKTKIYQLNAERIFSL